jgi:hypothetical protein
MRRQKEVSEQVPARPGRCRKVPDQLEVKEVWVDLDGKSDLLRTDLPAWPTTPSPPPASTPSPLATLPSGSPAAPTAGHEIFARQDFNALAEDFLFPNTA